MHACIHVCVLGSYSMTEAIDVNSDAGFIRAVSKRSERLKFYCSFSQVGKHTHLCSAMQGGGREREEGLGGGRRGERKEGGEGGRGRRA